MIKVGFKKIAALLLTLALILPMVPFAASAAEGDIDPALIDTTRKGSITVTKYATANNSRPGPGTGMSGQTIPEGYTPLKGAEFVLVQIYGATDVMNYYNGTGNDLALDTTKLVKTESGWRYNGVSVNTDKIKTGTTAENGKYVFSGLSVGIYVLKEVTAPDQITTPLAETSLISIPMVNTATSSNNENAQWIYDVSVYPKNHESTGTLELTKVDQNDNPLQDVVFELYKKEFDKDGNLPTGDWEAVTTTIANNGTSTDLVLKTGADGKITLVNLPANLYGTQYKLVEVSAPNGYIVNQTPLYFKVNVDNTMSWNAATGEKGDCNNTNSGVVEVPTTTEEPKLSVKLRNEQLSLTKEVKANGGATWKTDEQYRLDDEITFRLTAYVPNNVAELATFEIKDLPSVGITDDNTSVTVKYTDNNQEKSLTGEQFSVTVIPAVAGTNGQGFKLTLTDSGKTATAGKFIQIEYKAHMNDKAVIAGNGNGNTATLTYSKYIGNSDTATYAITDEARVYTYQYQITKHKDSATGDVVGGVAFKLLDATNPENILKVVKLEDGKYRLAIATDADTVKTDTLVTKTDGTILIQGLGNGTYYLKETKTIPGYNLLSEPFEITVGVYEVTSWKADTRYLDTGRTVKEYQSTAYYKDAGHTTQFEDATATANSNVINKKGFVLPQTGGMGYLLFCTVGIVLIAGGAMLIFGGRKKKIR